MTVVVMRLSVIAAIAADPVWLTRFKTEVKTVEDLTDFLVKFAADKGFKVTDLDASAPRVAS